MGDLQVWAPQPSGFLNGPSSSRLLTSPSSSSSNPPPLSIASECLQRGEETTCEIIYRIQPTVVSEQRRRDVVEYIQRLIRGWVGCEVFPFGSVPLKTYLPDGDIDLTTVSCLNIEEALANEVRAVLEGEEQNPDSEFEVKDVQYIHAEVKLVKCLVQNIVIDISFNQLGGLCTLCFLEQVDHVIGKNHLFKRSIILIKAWCYYESRILGAHHGLISTYALETLVLYIFHLFHSSLNGPLAVLYRFLDYFCKFDWDKYCISLHGPVAISSLPEIVAETPETDGGEVLLSKEFLKSCIERFSTPRVVEANVRGFPQKYLNIIDPMKENNNLGRSVSKGNFYRIRSAFAYGARKLGRILLLPPESIGDELKKFFQNTLERHGSGQRPDVNDHISAMPYCASGIGSISFKSADEEKPIEEKNEKVVLDFPSIDSSATTRESKADYKRALIEDTKSMKISVTEKKNGVGNDIQSGTKYGGYQAAVQFSSSKEVGSVSGSRLAGDAQDLATTRLLGFRTTNESCKSSSLLGSAEACSSSVPKVHHAPHMYFSGQFAEDGKTLEKKHLFAGENHDWSKVKKSSVLATAYSPVVHSIEEEADWQGLNTSVSRSTTKGFTFWRQNADPSKELHGGKPFLFSGNSSTAFGSDIKGRSENSEGLAGLSDLSGDFDSHLKCLIYGNYCHEYIYPNAPLSPSGYQSKSWDLSREHARRSAALKRGTFPHASLNGVVPGPQFPPSYAYYPVTPPLISGAFNMEDFPKTRGTGTYFPITNHRLYRERNSPSRGGRNTTQGPPSANHNQFPRSRNNGRSATQTDSLVSPEKGSHEPPPPPPPPQLQLPAFGVAGRGKTSPVEFIPANRSLGKGVSHSNGFTIPPERLEFGTFGPVKIGGHLSEQVRLADSGPVKYSHGPGSLSTTTMPRPELVMKEERVSQAYHLKDEEDFPPLSV
ncbi:hypothetical protein H6P81_016819 [Aristolochia fimbriata]|uniref:Uncharacterized protein n=1 Tax=Aristolochia fimbriata TaxID=158543 RepID=A0AAV7EB28_ARIFI|nr:hypothetical protein H6P81_016819 [Aristolochia fimbriata]